jgi:nitric oxide reductase large subunit
MPYKKLWIALGFVLVISFAVLGGVGIKVLRSAPPISESPGAAGTGIL